MLFQFDDNDRDRLFVALMRAQGDILHQMENAESDKEKLRKEYTDLQKIAKIIQKTFEGENNAL